MQIRTLKVAEYRGCSVYIRNFNNVFEYLTVINGQLYTAHIVVFKGPLQSIFGCDYTEKHLTDTVKYLINTAEATVDYVLDGAKK
jgi:hypothetical protein